MASGADARRTVIRQSPAKSLWQGPVVEL